jgi:uncharacterized membrane protein YdbT with pleckstrin-like domain
MENHKKHSLGRRAFFLFLSKRLKWPVSLFIVTGALWWCERYLPQGYPSVYGTFATAFFFIVSCGLLAGVIVQTYFEYRYYTYTFTDEAFIMTYGYIMRNEVAALYHQIQNVNIYRSPADRLAGVSKVVIFMTGNEKDSPHNKIVLPAVAKSKAKLVQKELLTRARRHFGAVNGEG